MSSKSGEVSPVTNRGHVEGVVKRVTDGCFTLEHSRYVDSFGFLRDAFNLGHTNDETGFTNIYPFWPPIKVVATTAGNILDTTNDYTDEEYESAFQSEKQRTVTRLSSERKLTTTD